MIRGYAYDDKATTAVNEDWQGHIQLIMLCDIA